MSDLPKTGTYVLVKQLEGVVSVFINGYSEDRTQALVIIDHRSTWIESSQLKDAMHWAPSRLDS